MCEQDSFLKISRRTFTGAGMAGTLAACAPMAPSANTGNSIRSRNVSFQTADGTMDGVLLSSNDAAPAIIHWPDIAGLRPSMIEMGRRLAGEGYTVLVVNPYYRDRTGQIWEDFAAFADGGWDMARAMREKLSSDAVMRDAKAIVTWLDTQDEVDTARGIGTRGFCMGGPFTVYTAHAVPPRIKAAASFHGGGLVREDDQSPHKLLAETQASYLFAIAQDDDAKAPQDKTVLRQSADAAGRPAMVDVYAGDHGWTVPDSPAYDRAAAERAYADGFALFSRAL